MLWQLDFNTVLFHFSRLYQFVGTVPTSSEPPMFQHIFSQYEDIPGMIISQKHNGGILHLAHYLLHYTVYLYCCESSGRGLQLHSPTLLHMHHMRDLHVANGIYVLFHPPGGHDKCLGRWRRDGKSIAHGSL